MFSNTFRANTKFLIDLKSSQTITDKQIVLYKDEREVFFKYNDHKLKLEPTEQEKKIYKISSDIDQSLILSTTEGKYLVYFVEHPDFLCAIDWLEMAMPKEFHSAYNVRASSIINNATHKVYLDKEVSFIKEDSYLYFEFEGLKIKLNYFEDNHLFKVSNDVDQAFVIATNRANFLIQFVLKSDFLDVMDWLDKMTQHQRKSQIA